VYVFVVYSIIVNGLVLGVCLVLSSLHFRICVCAVILIRNPIFNGVMHIRFEGVDIRSSKVDTSF